MLKMALLTNVGGREVNEDSVRGMIGDDSLCAVLADGLGGHGGGDIASKATVDFIMRAYETNLIMDPSQLENAIDYANRLVCHKQTELCEMKSTVVVLRIEGDKVFWAHVGDSRLYQFVNGKLAGHTRDHSASQLAVLMGEISEEQIRFHSQRSKILRALGAANPQPDMSEELCFNRGTTCFLLCSDGFWEYVLESEMEQALMAAKSPDEWLLSMEAILKSKVQPWNDNYSAIAVFA